MTGRTMADAELIITCRLAGGADKRALEVHQLLRAAELVVHKIKSEGAAASYTATAENGATATAVYRGVAGAVINIRRGARPAA